VAAQSYRVYSSYDCHDSQLPKRDAPDLMRVGAPVGSAVEQPTGGLFVVKQPSAVTDATMGSQPGAPACLPGRGPRPLAKAVERAQAMVEFMLILPVLLLILLGFIELGRMLFALTEATSASREASRYGASVGLSEGGAVRYLDCAGMLDAAKRVVVLSDLPDSNVQITWDRGSIDQTIASCDAPPSPADIKLGDRVVVSVTLQYRPLVPLVALPSFPIVSRTARTIMIDIAAGPTATLGGVSYTETPTTPTTPTPGDTPTPTVTSTGDTPTPTETQEPGSTPLPSATATAPPTATPIPAPGNFAITVNCTNGNLRLTWNAVSGAHYYAVYEAPPTPPDEQICLTNKTRCDYASIQPDGVVHTYYVVAYIYTRPSLHSNVQSVSCPAPG